MAGFVCAHCGETTDIFGKNGGKKMAEEYNIPFLGSIPIDPYIVTSGDTGKPVIAMLSNSVGYDAFKTIITQL